MINNIEFELFKDYKEPSFNINEKAHFVIYPMILLLMLIGYVLKSNIILLPVLILTVLLLLSKVRSFFSQKEHTKSALGKIVFALNHVQWQDQIIEWDNLKRLKIEVENVQGELVMNIVLENDHSNGLNEVILQTKDDITFDGHYRITNQTDKENLKQLFQKIVTVKGLHFEVAKELVKPKNYREIQKLKKHTR